jgi:hypothetical protein
LVSNRKKLKNQTIDILILIRHKTIEMTSAEAFGQTHSGQQKRSKKNTKGEKVDVELFFTFPKFFPISGNSTPVSDNLANELGNSTHVLNDSTDELSESVAQEMVDQELELKNMQGVSYPCSCLICGNIYIPIYQYDDLCTRCAKKEAHEMEAIREIEEIEFY